MSPSGIPSGIHRAYIGLGANLNDPAAQLERAFQALAALPDSCVASRSSLYRSRPMGPAEQPDYVNAVALLETSLTAHQLLRQLQAIEQAQGRVRKGERWGPRTLDLDILLYDDARIGDSELSVPHPGLAEREFVLFPLSEIAPDLDIPGLGPLKTLVQACPRRGLRPVSE